MTKRIVSIWILLAIFGVQISAAQGNTSPSGEIAFTSNRNGIYQIYLMNADGSNVRQLTHETINAYSPIWSPDGQKLAYGTPVKQGAPDSYWILKVVNADGSQSLQIADHAASTYYLAWSLDSQEIVYAELLGAENAHLLRFHRIKADGTEDQLLNLPAYIRGEGYLFGVKFLSNGTLLAAYTAENCGLSTADPDGSHRLPLSKQICAPEAISPDGQHIVGSEGSTIVEINSQGNQHQSLFEGLTNPNRQDFRVESLYWIDWSPNGSYIWGAVIASPPNVTTTPGIRPRSMLQPFIGTAKGDEYWLPKNIADWSISWSPDSLWITFTTQEADGHYQVAVSEPIGANQMTITSGSDNSQPAWRPFTKN